jgi:hypothetical protein
MKQTKSERGLIIENIVNPFIKDYLFTEKDTFRQVLQEKLDGSLNFKADVLTVGIQNDITFGEISFMDENNSVRILNFSIIPNEVTH